MTKKVLSIILALFMTLSIFSLTAFAAKDQFTTITSVKVGGVASPAFGTEPLYYAEAQTAKTSVGTIEWYQKTSKSDTGTKMKPGDKFIPGYYYAVSIQLNSADKAYFKGSNGVTATVNGKTATVSGNSGIYTVTTITVTYTFDMCLGTVSKFNVNFTTPVAGATPSYNQITGTGYESNNTRNNGAAYKNGIYWRNDTDGTVLYPNQSTKFEAGKKYTVHANIVTTTGYKIASSYTVTVNGKTVTSNITKVDNECIAIEYSFTVPKGEQSVQTTSPATTSPKAPDTTAPKAPADTEAPAATTTKPIAATEVKPVTGSNNKTPADSVAPIEDIIDELAPTSSPLNNDDTTLSPNPDNGDNNPDTIKMVIIIILAVLLLGAIVAIVVISVKKKKK